MLSNPPSQFASSSRPTPLLKFRHDELRIARRWLQHSMSISRACWLMLLSLLLPAALHAADTFNSVYISELMADCQRGLLDDDGERSGWIELYNGGSGTVSLNGWFLTDTRTNLAKWRFPRVTLLPEKHMLIFASGKGRTNNLVRLHTNFRLTAPGGYLALVNARTNIVSEFTYPRQAADVSYGRVRGEPAIAGPLLRPSPGKPNAIKGEGFAPEVVFSHRSGTFQNAFTLKLSSGATNAIIRFTLDGTLPRSNSAVYTAPLLITNTAYVRARAYRDGVLPGPPASESYLRLHTNVAKSTSTLPVLLMETFGKEAMVSPGSEYAFVHLSFFEPVEGETSLTNGPTLTTRAGFHTRGSSSSGMPQPSFAVEFLDEFNQEHNRGPLGLPPDSDWVLYAPNSFDPVMIHNPFVHQLSRDMGCYSPRTRFVEVYLARTPGPVGNLDYYGIYVLEEKIKAGKHRVNVERPSPEDVQAPEVTGGYLLKVDRQGPGEMGFYAGGVSMVYVDPKERVMSLPERAPQREYVQKYLNDFDNALNGPKWRDPLLGYPAYVNVEGWIDYHVLEVLSGNVDALHLSAYFYKPRNGKLVFGPHWDFDRALGSTDHRDQDPRQWNTGRFFDAPWWNTLFSDPDFWQRWVDRWQELRESHFSTGNLHDLIDSLTDELKEAHPRQVKRWGLHPRGGTYRAEINHMKDWLSNRIDYIDGQLVQPPQLGHKGGSVRAGLLLSISTATNTSIYYTLDGSDPRLSQGAISSNAIVYTGPIELKQNTELVVRARNPGRRQYNGPPSSTPWSRPIVAKFTVTSP